MWSGLSRNSLVPISHLITPFPPPLTRKETPCPSLLPSITLSETEACQAIAAAVAEGVRAEPQLAAGKVIDSLQAAFGPLVQKIVALIEAGANNLPAILAALTAAGVTLPSWVGVVASDPDRGDEAAVNRRV